MLSNLAKLKRIFTYLFVVICLPAFAVQGDVSFKYVNHCINNVIQFIPEVEANLHPVAYYWDFGDASFSNDKVPYHAYENPGVYQINFTILNENGEQLRFQQDIEVFEFPMADFSYLAKCNQGLELNDQSFSTLPIHHTEWTINNQTYKDLKQLSYETNQSTKAFTKLYVSNSKGCVDSVQQNIDLLPSPNVNIELSSACTNENTKITINPTNNKVDIEAVQWKVNEETQFELSSEISITQPGEYFLEGEALATNGCIQHFEKHFSVAAPPSLDVKKKSLTACSPYLVNLELTSSDQLSHVNWLLNNEVISTNFIDSLSIVAPGNYTIGLKVFNHEGCSTLTDSVQNIVLQASPEINTQVIAEVNSSNKAVAKIVSSSDAQELLVDWGDGNQEHVESNASHFYKEPDKYLIKAYAMNTNGCMDSTLHFTYFQEKYLIEATKIISPNSDGFNDQFQILTHFDENLNLMIYDYQGQLIYHTNDHHQGWKASSANQPTSGLYFYQLENPDNPGLYIGGSFLIQK